MNPLIQPVVAFGSGRVLALSLGKVDLKIFGVVDNNLTAQSTRISVGSRTLKVESPLEIGGKFRDVPIVIFSMQVAQIGLQLSKLGLRRGVDYFAFYDFRELQPVALEIPEEPLWANISSFVDPGDVAIDVGSNTGLYSLALARATGYSGAVYGFEPQEHLVRESNIFLSLFPAKKPRIHHFALQDQEQRESVEVNIPKIDGVASTGHAFLSPSSQKPEPENQGNLKVSWLSSDTITMNCPATTLDAAVEKLELPHLNFLKLDVEGAENLVLRGGRKTLRSFSPIIAVEISPEYPSAKLEQTLREEGYTCHSFDEFNLPKPRGWNRQLHANVICFKHHVGAHSTRHSRLHLD